MAEPERGSIRLAPILKDQHLFPEGHLWAAEFGGFQGTAPTKDGAVDALRRIMREKGREAPTHVYDVAGTIAGWMN